MSKFDDLLDQVLCEDGNQQPPVGLEERLMAACLSRVARTPGHSAIWPKIAAVLIIGAFGVATWMLVGILAAPLIATYSVPRVLERGATPPSGSFNELPKPRVDRIDGQRRRSRELLRSPMSLRQRSIRVAPVIIEPLTINPIDLATFSLDDPTMKGNTK